MSRIFCGSLVDSDTVTRFNCVYPEIVKRRRRTRAASCGASKAPLHEVGTSLS